MYPPPGSQSDRPRDIRNVRIARLAVSAIRTAGFAFCLFALLALTTSASAPDGESYAAPNLSDASLASTSVSEQDAVRANSVSLVDPFPQPATGVDVVEATAEPADAGGSELPWAAEIGLTRVPYALAGSLEMMVDSHDLVIVGEIESVLIPYDPRPGYAGQPPPDLDDPRAVPPDPEAYKRPPGRTTTTFGVRATEVVTGDRSGVGELIPVKQGGGHWNGEEREMWGEPIMRVGDQYLMFLEESTLSDEVIHAFSFGDFWAEAGPVIKPGDVGRVFTGPAFGRFNIDDDGVLTPVADRYKYLQAVADLNGKSLDAAVEAIKQAAAGTFVSTDSPPPLPHEQPIDQPEPLKISSIAVDAVGSNEADALGPREACGTASPGGETVADITAADIPAPTGEGPDRRGGMVGFQFTLSYDPSAIKIADIETDLMLGALSGSNHLYVGHAIDSGEKTGQLIVAALDLSAEGDLESGDGVLARITWQALKDGVADVSISDVLIVDAGNVPYTVGVMHGGSLAVGQACA